MQRDTAALSSSRYDLIVVGAGIYGACIARDAALRGLHVALVDRGDFGNATTHNSFKLIHGGLRYVQHMDFRRIRESILETRFWLRAAPRLVRPLEFVMPTDGHGTRGPEALLAGLKIHQLVGLGGHTTTDPQAYLPAGRVVSRAECLRRIPGLDSRGVTGGAIWFDGQMQDADRILLAVVQGAAEAGADIASYVAVERLLGAATRVEGVAARDMLSGRDIEIRGKVTVNACGPWAAEFLGRGGHESGSIEPSGLIKGMNLVTRRLFDGYAVAIKSGRTSDAVIGRSRRLYFITPWRDCSLIGTTHTAYTGHPDEWRITEEDIVSFLGEINSAYPPAALKLDDVLYCYSGLTPGTSALNEGEVEHAWHSEVIDHERRQKVGGLISVVGVKFTTARLVAERAVDLVFRKFGKTPPLCAAKLTPLPCLDVPQLEVIERDVKSLIGKPLDRNLEFLLESQGAGLRGGLPSRMPSGECMGEILFRYGCRQMVRDRMAMRLTDLIFRRTDWSARGLLTQDTLNWCADMMSEELGWTTARRQDELNRLQAEGERHFFRPALVSKGRRENSHDVTERKSPAAKV